MILLSLLFAQSVWAVQGPIIRVRVLERQPSIFVQGENVRIHHGPTVASGALTAAHISPTGPSAWRIEDRLGRTHQIQAPHLRVRGQRLIVNREVVPVDLVLMSSPKTGVDVIARLDLEDYLVGVLPHEMPASWPLEALKAQAVAARSFALRAIRERAHRLYDVESSVLDQVYRFLPGQVSDRVLRATSLTRGQFLVDREGQVLKAFYSADCGCQSEDPIHVWGPVASIVSVREPRCRPEWTTTWQHELSLDELNQVAGQRADQLVIRERTPSGRVKSVRLQSLVSHLDIPAQKFRQMVGFKKIRSQNFEVSQQGRAITIRGYGVGHGVGLCQLGAARMARNGGSYVDILRHYYPKAHLTQARPI